MGHLKPNQLAAWRSELENDPAGLGYAGKSHEEIERLLESVERDVDNDRKISGDELFELLDTDEYLAVVDANKRAVLSDLLRLGAVNPASKGFRKAIDTVFGAQSKTAKNLDKLKKRKGNRWEELALPKPDVSDIANALR